MKRIYRLMTVLYLAGICCGNLRANEAPRFTGEFHEEQSGLIYLRNRNFDPETGSFTTKDPIGVTGGLNAYSYAANNHWSL